jgi:quinoprotein glucose dehydrogenase
MLEFAPPNGRELAMHTIDAPRIAVACALAGLAACSPRPDPISPLAPRPGEEHLDAGDWPTYNRDLAGLRFSPLEQLDAGNVADLRQAWVYPLGRNTTTGSLTGGSETTPIAIAGTLFVTAADRVVALRADTGQELWRHVLDRGSPSRRGLAYWPGERNVPARVFFTSGRRLIALDAATGRKALAFGGTGEIEMPAVYNAAPTRFENLLIVGSNTPPGGVRAFDARTGAPVWVFDTVPQADEPGRDTWRAGSAARASVVGWSFSFTVDVDRALLYVSLAGPAPDAFGGDRPGDNLYANSVVALDARSGERRWHFQTVHHDLWDYDLPAAPALLDVAIGGATVPVLAQAAKSGYLYVLNRVTGEPVFGVEERPAPASDVPGEHAAGTQPIPLKPGPIARVAYSSDDLVTREETSVAHADFCRALRERGGGLQNSGPFTPYRFRADGKPPRSTLVFPGSLGGANWGGAAVDPTLGFLFVNTSDLASLGWIEAPPDEASAPAGEGAPTDDAARYRRASALAGPLANFWWSDAPGAGSNELGGGERAWPCQKPPWGQLVAVNVASGEIAWQVPLGITEQLPEAKQRTGRVNLGGPIATAGGLVFIGATNDRRFRAFSSRTGAELWAARLELSAHAVPITYLGSDGKQYVAIVAAGAGAIDGAETPDAQALVAFALP